jgi:hypothetical protein
MRYNNLLYGILCEVRAYAVTVSYHRSTWIMYKKGLLGTWVDNSKVYLTLLLVLKITQLQIKYWYEISLWYIANYVQEEFEDAKGVIRIRKPKDRQHKNKSTNINLQNITQKT